MIALALALISAVAGMLLPAQPPLNLLRAVLYALSATSLAYGLLRDFQRRVSASEPDLSARLIRLADGPAQSARALPLARAQRLLKRRSCHIQQTPHGYTLTDQGAPQGVYLNGRRLPLNAPVSLHSGDEIAFGLPHAGGLVLCFRGDLFPPLPAAPTETQRAELSDALSAPALPSEVSRAQFVQQLQRDARRTSVLPLILPSRAEEAPPSEPDRHDA